MAKRRGRPVKMPVDADGQLTLIDTDHPAGKELIAHARKLRKLNKEYQTAHQDILKPKRKAEAELTELMKSNNLTAFRGGGFVVELEARDEKVKVKYDDGTTEASE